MKLLYTVSDNMPRRQTSPVYSINWRSSVAFQRSKSLTFLGVRANSTGSWLLSDTRASDKFLVARVPTAVCRGPLIYKYMSLRITPRQLRCI